MQIPAYKPDIGSVPEHPVRLLQFRKIDILARYPGAGDQGKPMT